MRGRRLPDVFAARGRVPLPRGLPRPRAGWGLLGVAVVASLGAAWAIQTGVAAVLAVRAAATGDPSAAVGHAGLAALGAVLTPLLWRATRWATGRWLAREDARRGAEPGGPWAVPRPPGD
ncbi:hypothetical protein [Patulibacter sp. SYSU D01012]|uniref:hypothetical protein n=1 Tax=Patulibacter sp. SYSU D01012 TaxID=2817381 RepID=UPI001B314642|nr:hypothetical protein [Patulibacter sp. SYSU D01012]